jgi:membrane dipeptidase
MHPGFLLALLAGLFIGCSDPGRTDTEIPEGKETDLETRVRKLHEEALVIDTHSDTTLRMLDPEWNFMERHENGHVDYPRLREGGLDALFLAVFMGKQKPEEPGIAVQKAMTQFDRIHSLVEDHGDCLGFARTAADIRRIAEEGRTAILIGLEGGHILDNKLEVLRCYHRLGCSYVTLTHTFHHDWADSAGMGEDWEPLHGGLTDFGREVIREMNRLGVMADVSHVSDDTFWDVLEVSDAPVVATHSGARAVCDHVRNLSDDMIRALAEKGGVVQVVFFPGFLDPDFKRKWEIVKEKRGDREAEIRKLYKNDDNTRREKIRTLRREYPIEPTPFSMIVDHIDHIKKVAGPDHVGLGADWDGVSYLPEGMEDCSKLPAITAELVERGYSDQDIIKILGGNILRVMEEVERVAASR